MPTYDFLCDCGYELEEICSFTSPKIRKCPVCKKRSLVRLIGAGSGFSFGSGYTDKSGEKIWFPKNGDGYFDTAFRRRFNSAKEKAEFMNSKGIVSTGDTFSGYKKEKKQHHEMKMDTKKVKKNA